MFIYFINLFLLMGIKNLKKNGVKKNGKPRKFKNNL